MRRGQQRILRVVLHGSGRTGNGNGEHVDEHTGEPRSARPDIGNGPTADDTSTSSGDSAHTENRAYTETKDDEITNPPQVGKLDPNGITIDRIFKSTRRFAIYEAGGEVRYQLPNNSTTGQKVSARIAGLGGLRASIDDLRAELRPFVPMKRKGLHEKWRWALGPGLRTTARRTVGRTQADFDPSGCASCVA